MSDSNALDNAIGGWIPDANAGYDNAQGCRTLSDFAAADLDPRNLEYFQSYLDEYFNGPFIHGWGTEDILAALHAVPHPQRWLDLGAGTTSLLWAIPLEGLESATCCDLVPEALAVLDRFVRGTEVPRCYADVLEMYGLGPADLARRRQAFGEYLIFDTLSPWPSEMAARTFDLITAIGNFGLAPAAEGYKTCFGHLRQSLACGGQVVGADWVRSEAFIRQEGHDNSYVCPELTRAAAAEHGFEVLNCRYVPIQGDPLYDAIVVWRLQR